MRQLIFDFGYEYSPRFSNFKFENLTLQGIRSKSAVTILTTKKAGNSCKSKELLEILFRVEHGRI